MCACVRVCVRACSPACVHVSARMRVRACMRASVRARARARACVHACVCASMRASAPSSPLSSAVAFRSSVVAAAAAAAALAAGPGRPRRGKGKDIDREPEARRSGVPAWGASGRRRLCCRAGGRAGLSAHRSGLAESLQRTHAARSAEPASWPTRMRAPCRTAGAPARAHQRTRAPASFSLHPCHTRLTVLFSPPPPHLLIQCDGMERPADHHR